MIILVPIINKSYSCHAFFNLCIQVRTFILFDGLFYANIKYTYACRDKEMEENSATVITCSETTLRVVQ